MNKAQITDDLIERIEIMSRQYKEDLDKEQGYTLSERVFQECLLAACESIADEAECIIEDLEDDDDE